MMGGCVRRRGDEHALHAGVNLTNASDTALIYAVVPVWGMILGSVLGLERPTLRGILGVGIAFLGIIVVVYGGWAVAARVSKGIYWSWEPRCVGGRTLYSLCPCSKGTRRWWSRPIPCSSGPGHLPFALPSFLSVDWDAMSVGVWAAVAYSTVLVGPHRVLAWQKGASLLGANKVLVYQYLITFVGVTSGIVLLGEGLGVEKIVGGAIIPACI